MPLVEGSRGAPGIVCREIHKAYATRSVLTAVDLQIDGGEVVAITGASGSGKTTLLLTMAGLLMPDRGAVVVDGTSLYDLDDDARTRFRRQHIGLVFQFGQLVGELTAADNVVLPLLLGGSSRKDAAGQAAELLQELGVSDVADQYPHQLSGGQQQRVAIGRALITRPGAVLADEPTGSLDSDTAESVLSSLLQASRAVQAAVVVVTHDTQVAARADRQIHLHDGRVITRTAAP